MGNYLLIINKMIIRIKFLAYLIVQFFIFFDVEIFFPGKDKSDIGQFK